MTPTDDDAFEAIVTQHQAALYRYALRRVGAEEADDVVAEVFAAAWSHRARLPDQLEPWLYRTAWHALLHQFRSARRRASLAARLQAQATPARGDSGGAEVQVRAALSRLRPVDQELLRLAYWEELDAAAIASIVGGTPQAVRVRLHRARRRLAAVLPDGDRIDDRVVAPSATLTVRTQEAS